MGGNRRLNSADQAEPAVEPNRLAGGQMQLSVQTISRDTKTRVKLDRVWLGHDKIVDLCEDPRIGDSR